MENQTEIKKEVVNEKTNKELFLEKLDAIIKETGCQLIAYPKFIARDDGSFSVVIAYEVIEDNKK